MHNLQRIGSLLIDVAQIRAVAYGRVHFKDGQSLEVVPDDAEALKNYFASAPSTASKQSE